MQEELRHLRQENQKLRLHQEILKKAVGILSNVMPPGDMPLIQLMAQQYPIKALCEVLGVPRSSYYAWLGREPCGQRALVNQRLRENLSRLFVSHRKVYGSPRLTVCLQRLGIGCSRNRVARHMRALQLKARH